MSEKRLCTIESCTYCPYLEDLGDFQKCKKTKLCIESNNPYKPYNLLFEYCPLPKYEQKRGGWFR